MSKLLFSFTLWLISLFPCLSSAQNSSIYVDVSYGTFNMASSKDFLKELNDNLENSIGIPSQIMVDYPGNIIYEFGYSSQWNKAELGFSVQKTSTGGKISYSDYTGEINIETLLVNYALSINALYKLSTEPALLVYGGINVGISTTDYNYSLLIDIYDNVLEKTNTNLSSFNIFLGPELLIRKPLFSNGFFVFGKIAYQQDIVGKLFLDTDDNAYLLNQSGDAVYTDWSGLRIGLGVGITFIKNEN